MNNDTTALHLRRNAREGCAVVLDSHADAAAQAANFITVLSHMSQGLCLFDAAQRLVVCNHRYLEIYGVPQHLARPGVTLREILEHRIAGGNYPQMDGLAYIEERMKVVRDGVSQTAISQLRDRRIIAISHEPMADGGWLATHDDVTQIYALQREITHMADHDDLTGLPNRRKLGDEALLRRGLSGDFALLLLDLDGFKRINDDFGHPAGDALLRQIAGRLRRSVPDTDTVARLGGDEFAILMADVTDLDEVRRLSDQIIDVVSTPAVVDGHSVRVEASIGVALSSPEAQSGDTLMRQADFAMYEAKRAGGSCVCLFSERRVRCNAAGRDRDQALSVA